ncbi:MAG: enoyl-CoA hydratase/isomerase family protein [Phycisphaerales bacterium]|jgi:enoyl-CoA hydratase/carnithine racemase
MTDTESTTSGVRIERTEDGICILSLPPSPTKPRGGVVVLDRWLVSALEQAILQVAESSPRGVVLESASERVFVAGADLAEIDGLDDAELDRYLADGAACFGRLLDLPCPTVALVHGAALGGGLELAMHCDGLGFVEVAEGAKPYLVGLPEASLGICPGWGGTQMLPARIDPTLALERTASGSAWKANDLPAGLADFTAADRAALREAGLAWIRDRGSPPTRPRAIASTDRETIEPAIVSAGLDDADRLTPPAAVVAAVRAGLEGGYACGLAEERRQLIALRGTEATRAKLSAFLARS